VENVDKSALNLNLKTQSSSNGPSQRLRNLKPISLDKQKVTEKFRNLDGFEAKSPAFIQTATHKYNKQTFLIGHNDLDSSLPAVDSAMLPMGSLGFPKLNGVQKPKILHKVKEIRTPLTSFNHREKQFKRSLSGTYGKGYNHPCSHEEQKAARLRLEQDHISRRKAADNKKDMHEHIKDINFEK
jgi:hypothetical protein